MESFYRIPSCEVPTAWIPEKSCQVQELSCPCPAFQNQQIQNLFSAACYALIDDRVPTSNPTSRGKDSFTQKKILYAPLSPLQCNWVIPSRPTVGPGCRESNREKVRQQRLFHTVIEIEIDTTGTLPHYQGHPSFRS